MPVEIVSVVDAGLGHSGHVVAVDGQALIVDPLRAVDRYLRVIEARGWSLRWVADTHTHADYVSGGPALVTRGAIFYASRGADLLTDHRAVDGGDELDLDGLTVRALPTPGHTPDHLAFLLLDGRRPVAVFSGGSLMVGAVGRTDLLGPERAEDLARVMFRSLHEQLLVLPDDVAVYPTHGAGSFCSAPAASERTSSIGWERAHNPLLQIADEDTFVARLVGGVGPLPDHFRWLPEVNRRGVGPPPRLPLPSLSPARVRDLMEAGARVIDVRPVRAFAAGHVAGSLSIALRPAFGSWLGWLVPPDRPLVFVTDPTTDVAELVDQCANVGFDHLAGVLAGSIDAWSGLPTDSLPVVEAERVDGAVLDVRTADEYTAGHLPDARHVDVGELASRVDEVAVPVDVMCGHGERAATAASLLAAAGRTPVRIVVGGPADWSRASGVPLETGG